MTIPTEKNPNDAFAYLLSSSDENSKLMRTAVLSDFQVGLPEKPSELQLTGRISYSTAFAEVQPSQIVYFPPDITIFLVSILPFEILRTGVAYSQLEDFKQTITVVLPQDPRVGQVCYVKDASGTAHVCAIKVQGSKIDGDDSKLLDYKDGCIGFIWSGAAWSTLSDGNQRSSDDNLLNKTIQAAIESYGPATTDPAYIVLTSSPSLPNERVLTAGSGITITDGGAGGSLTITAAGGGSGDVVGPASATDNAIARFDLTTGKLIQNSGVTIDDSNNVTVAGRIIVTGGTTSLTDATLGNAAVGSFPYYDGGGNSAVYAMFGHKDLDHSSVVTNYALYQDNTGNTSINASTGKNLYFAINNVAMGAITNDIGSGVDAILFTGDLATRTDVLFGNYTGASATTVYAGTGDLNIGHNAADRTVNLGTGNNTTEQDVTVGSTSGRSLLVLRAGTGDMYLTGAVATDFIIGHTAGTGDITVGRSTASNTINIGNANTATTKTQTINIGAGTPAGTGKATVTVGNAGGASATNIYAGTGGITLSGSATTTITGSTSGQADAYIGTVEIGELPATKTSFPAVYAMFGHKALDHSADGNYALVQSNVGDTYLGAASAKAVVFKNGTSIVGYLDDNEISLTGKPSTAQDVTLGSTYGGSSLTINVGTGELKLASGSFAASRKISIGVGGDGTGNSETQTIYVGKYNPAGGTINAYLRGDNVIIGDDGGAVTIGRSGTAVTFSGDASITHDLAINGGDLTTNVATFNLLNSTVTTLNVGGVATTIEIGAATGTTSINNALTVDGNTTLGNATSDTVTINGTTTFAGSAVTTTFDGDVAVNGGDLTTTAPTMNLVNAATTVNLGSTAVARTTNIATGVAVQTVNIGTGASANIVSVGSTTGAASLTLQAGTGNLALTGGTTTNYTVGSATGTGTLTIGQSTNTNTINIGNAATTTGLIQTVNVGSGIGVGTGKSLVTIGSTANASALTLDAGTGTIGIGTSAAARTTNIATGAAAQTVTLGSTYSTSATTINAGTGVVTIASTTTSNADALIGAAEIGTHPYAGSNYAMFGHKDLNHAVDGNYALVQSNVGDTFLGAVADKIIYFKNGTKSLGYFYYSSLFAKTIFSLDGAVGSPTAITIGSTHTTSNTTINAGSGSIDIGITPQSRSINIGTGTSVQTIGIGTGAAANLISIGSNAASTVSVNGGDALNLYADGGTITIDAGGAGANAISVGTSGYAQTISVGNTTGATSLAFRAGSGGITFETAVAASSNLTITGDLTVNGGDIIAAAAPMNLVNAATTINLGSTAVARTTNIATGAAVQTVTLGSTYGGSSLTLNGESFVALGASGGPAIQIGSSIAGAVSIDSAGSVTISSSNLIATGDLAVNGGDLTSNVATFNLLNSTVTTLNVGGAATAIELGAATGTTSINNALSVDGSTTLGDSSVDTVTVNGTTTFAGSSVTTTFDGDIAVNGGDITTTAGTFNLANSATTLAIANSVTANQTVNIAAGATAFTALKTLNIGTGGGAGSTTNIKLGSANGGTTTINSSNTVTSNLAVNGGDLTTTAATMNLVNAATTINLGSTAVARTTNIATGAAVQTVTLGSAYGGSSLALDAGSGDINIGTAQFSRTTTIGPIRTNTASAITHTTDIGYIPTHASAITNVNIGTAGVGSTKNAIAIGNYNSTVASTTVIYGDTISIGATGTAAQTISIGTSAAVRTTEIATGAANQTVSLGSTHGGSSLTLSAGSGSLNLGTSNAARTINIGSDPAGTATTQQTINIGAKNTSSFNMLHLIDEDSSNGHEIYILSDNGTQATGTSVVEIGTVAAATRIDIGKSTVGAKAVTIGGTGGASATTINAGTGGITLSGSAATVITGSSTTNAEAYIGLVEIGELPWSKSTFPGVFAMFGHKTLVHTDLNYGLVQSNVGDTFLNAASGKSVFIANNGSSIAQINTSVTSFTGSLTTTITGNSTIISGSNSLTLMSRVNGGRLLLSGSSILMTGSIGINLPGRTPVIGSGIHIKQQKDPTAVGTTITDNSAALRIEDDDGDGWIIGAGGTGQDNYLTFSWDLSSVGGDGTSTAQGYLRNNANAFTLMNFTGQHRCTPHAGVVTDFSEKIGLIVITSGDYLNPISGSTTGSYNRNIGINDATPTVLLASSRNDKRAFGIVSEIEDVSDGAREFAVGKFVSVTESGGAEDNRLFINAIGEGAIWVCNINGNLENGDYITTCEILGYGMKQDDDLLHNYTVAKITCNCDFSLNNNLYQCEEFIHEGITYRRAFVGCTYHCG